MVKAWYINNDRSDQDLKTPEFLSQEELFKKTGVEYFYLNIDTYATDGVLDKIKQQRGYSYEDELLCSEDQKDYEEKIKAFFTEHLHADEEIRFVIDGMGNFDVRDDSDKWIRIVVSAGDMIILPGGIYHRFTLGPDKYIKMKRLFVEEPVWKSYIRPADDMQTRKEYVEKLHRGFAGATSAAC